MPTVRSLGWHRSNLAARDLFVRSAAVLNQFEAVLDDRG
jgi:hypothetical protein